MKRIATVLTGLLLSLQVMTGVSAAQTQSPTLTPVARVQAIVEPSVVYIETYYKAYVKHPLSNGWLGPYEFGGRCTGFIVSPDGYVVTAGHCVDTSIEGAKRTAVEMAVQDMAARAGVELDQEVFETFVSQGLNDGRVQGEGAGAPIDRTIYVARGVATSGLKGSDAKVARLIKYTSLSKGDVALLKIEDTNLPAVELSPASSVQVGTEVFSIGYPASREMVQDQSLTPTVKEGTVSSLGTREGGSLPVWEMSAALSPGMSGGPTVDIQGRVIGVNSMSLAAVTGEESFNWVSPVSLITETLSGSAARAELGPLDREYRQGVDLLAQGDGKGALPHFEAVLTQVPSHAKAQELKLKAMEVAKTQKSFPIFLIIGIVGGLAVIGGAAFFVVRSRKPSGSPQSHLSVIPTGEAVPSNGHVETVTIVAEAPVASEISEPVAHEAAAAEPATEAMTAPALTEATSGTIKARNGRKPQADASTTATATATKKFCSTCGAPATPGVRFCSDCGSQL